VGARTGRVFGMAEKKTEIKSIDDYIAQHPAELQEKLQILRKAILDAAPGAQEKMSWQMPTFALQGNVAHFAVCKKHIGFYPGDGAVAAFRDEAEQYKGTKGSLHLPMDQPLPLELIGKMVKFSVAENKERAGKKRGE
jgi:uncharacterized protein YdhG (YjbR/CyaY superfamily)